MYEIKLTFSGTRSMGGLDNEKERKKDRNTERKKDRRKERKHKTSKLGLKT